MEEVLETTEQVALWQRCSHPATARSETRFVSLFVVPRWRFMLLIENVDSIS